MVKGIGFIGNLGAQKPRTKDNTGNIIHGHAARAIFQNKQNVKPAATPENLEKIRAEVSHLGFVAATMLHVGQVPGYIDAHVQQADFIEALDLPVCTFGFGCHAALGTKISEAEVDPRSIRLLRVLAERSATVAVRGEFTADLCAKYGVKNAEVIGCQSIYYSAAQHAPGSFRHRATTGRQMASLSQKPDETAVVRFMVENGVDYIGQNDLVQEKIVLGELSAEDFAKGKNHWVLPSIRKVIDSGWMSAEAYHAYVKEHFHVFYNVPTWTRYIAENYDFAFGSRFHGNVAALQAGVPALWLEHDMRLQELCSHFALPSIAQQDFAKLRSVDELKALCDFAPFELRLPRLMDGFLGYLDKNGVMPFVDPGFVRQCKGWISGQHAAA